MSLTRRRLFQQLADRGRGAALLDQATSASPVLRISLNENPVGPGQQVLDALIGTFHETSRYPFNAVQNESTWDAESTRNHAARAFTIKWFADRGCKSTDSQTNFIFVDIKRPATVFRDACAKENVLVARISIGSTAEMQRAVQTFERALAKPAAAA